VPFSTNQLKIYRKDSYACHVTKRKYGRRYPGCIGQPGADSIDGKDLEGFFLQFILNSNLH
jgi:hypothetical protein